MLFVSILEGKPEIYTERRAHVDISGPLERPSQTSLCRHGAFAAGPGDRGLIKKSTLPPGQMDSGAVHALRSYRCGHRTEPVESQV